MGAALVVRKIEDRRRTTKVSQISTDVRIAEKTAAFRSDFNLCSISQF